ncbi:tyrosine-type recombinase/integrase [Microvirga massiliensis]|uniref:tyrosine-type recombinase/integrase n=1 Tax=Microvirga massiliensis TaxID=1033741 RepID=UPI00062BB369|nr:site-specific integrase [Microvirga massiliensis]
MPRITKRLVDSLKPSDREQIVWDDEIAGFGIRVTPTGAKAYILKYRVGHGRTAPIRKPTLGRHGDITADEARQIAKIWKARIALGGNPAQDREDRTKAPTINALVDAYLASHAHLKRSGGEDRRMIERDIRPALGSRRVAEITRRDIETFRDSQRSTPIAANRKLALLSKMLNLAIGWGWITSNPVDGVQRNHENRRERYLSQAEIQRFNDAAEAYVGQAAQKSIARRSVAAIRLLALTGARRGEVLSARWEQFNLETGTWTKPSSHTKQKRIHRVPLSPVAVELLLEIQAEGEHPSGYVFPAKGGSSGHMTDIKKAWEKIRGLADLPGVRLHDLRHTYASILASDGLSLPIIGALLGHTQANTTQRYTHLLDDPLREATSRVGKAFTTRAA